MKKTIIFPELVFKENSLDSNLIQDVNKFINFN